MKTKKPLILTARLADEDIEPFDRMRRAHFPPERNFLRAHMTMFHRLPGEYAEDITAHLVDATSATTSPPAQTAGVRHLGAGVAFSISSPELLDLRQKLKSAFAAWLGGQDMQKWQPHITVQNKVSKTAADALYKQLQIDFMPKKLRIIGLDLWRYLGGPWEHQFFTAFKDTSS